MRIALDTTYARRGPSGTATYLDQLNASLRELEADVVELSNPRRRPPAGGGLGSARNLATDAYWTQVELPRRAVAAGADVLHHPLPALSRRCAIPQVVTVHDLAFVLHPELFDPAWRRVAERTHRAAATGAEAVVAVSRCTAEDLLRHWGVEAEVAPHGPGQPLEVTPGEPRHLLYVGDDEPRKDLATLLAAYHAYRNAAGDAALPLVLAGRTAAQAALVPAGHLAARGEAALADEAAAHGDDVHHVPSPDPAALADLYAHAAALVHPSRHEGFGLTPLEAMAAGVPVIATRVPALTETCAGVARLVHPRDPAAMAAEIARIAGDPELRRRIGEQGRRHAAEFSWRQSAQAHLEVYTLAAGR